eukprot:m.222408 g.222408  ORF g.222408 m.222408 type:complete len:75 (-) comp33373_c2_seq19:269-493(-)
MKVKKKETRESGVLQRKSNVWREHLVSPVHLAREHDGSVLQRVHDPLRCSLFHCIIFKMKCLSNLISFDFDLKN